MESMNRRLASILESQKKLEDKNPTLQQENVKLRSELSKQERLNNGCLEKRETGIWDRNGNKNRNRNRNRKGNRNRNGKKNLYKNRNNIYLNLS